MCGPIRCCYVNIRSWTHPHKQLVALILHSDAIKPLQKRAQRNYVIKRYIFPPQPSVQTLCDTVRCNVDVKAPAVRQSVFMVLSFTWNMRNLVLHIPVHMIMINSIQVSGSPLACVSSFFTTSATHFCNNDECSETRISCLHVILSWFLFI